MIRWGRVLYRFETAWSTPDPWLLVVSTAHPALAFDHEFAEEFEQFAGRARVRAGELEQFASLEAADLGSSRSTEQRGGRPFRRPARFRDFRRTNS